MFPLVFLLGWFAGIFVNYIVDVMPRRRTLTQPICLDCGSEQDWVNYLFWPRKCTSCSIRRHIRIWITEVLLAGITLWYWSSASSGIEFITGWLIIIYFSIVVIIDLEHHLILHPISLVGGVIGATIGIWRHGINHTLLGGFGGAGLMLALYLSGGLFVRYVVRRDRGDFSDQALGFGDVILGTILGLLMGWPAIVATLIIAILLGGVFSLGYVIFSIITRKYKAYKFIPYGPFLISGAAILFFFREILFNYLNR